MATPTKRRLRSKLPWVLLLPIPLLWVLLSHYGALLFLENRLVDLRHRVRGEIPAPVKLVYVDVDTRAVEAMGERPWSRALYANAIEALFIAGEAKAVGVDQVLSSISSSGLVDRAKALKGNSELRRVLVENPGKVVLAAQYTPGSAVTQTEGTVREIPLLRKGRSDRSLNDIPEMPDAGFITSRTGRISRVGLIDVDVEYSGDAVPRWVPLFVHTSVNTMYHLSLQLVLQHLGLDESAVHIIGDRVDVARPDGSVALSIPLHEGQLLEANWFSRWENPELNPRVSMADVFSAIQSLNSEKPADIEQAKLFFGRFKEAIVLIGPTDPLLQDLAPTPFEPYPVAKVGLHGNLVKTLLSGRFLTRPPEWVGVVSTFVLSLVVSLLSIAGGARGVLNKLIACVVVAAYVAAALLLFSRWDVLLPMAAPLGAAFTTSFAAIGWQLISEERQKSRIKGMFGTYLAPTVVNRMVESGKDPELGGHDAVITAYFSDIQGFSSFSEVLSSAKLTGLLNEYLTACTDIVQAEMGTLDKYIGDAVVAMFGAPVDAPDHAYRACVASQLVQQRIAELRAKWRAEGDKWPVLVHHLRTRIGLNTGECMIGNMGSRSRFNYTMMGDNVNLAARMESGAKAWGVYTMCTESTKLACEQHKADALVFRALGRIVVKGRTTPVPIFEIAGLKTGVNDRALECVAVFEQGLARYYNRDWDGALACFAKSAVLEPNQPDPAVGLVSNPSRVYQDIVERCRSEPPPADWDGRYVMREK